MAIAGTTGWLAFKHGQSQQISIPGTVVSSARVRFKGHSDYSHWSDSNSGGWSVSFPSPPGGYSVTGGSAEFSVTITANDAGATGDVGVSASGGGNSTRYSLGPYGSTRVSVSTGCDGVGVAGSSWSVDGPPGGNASASSPSIVATAEAWREIRSADIAAVIAGELITGPVSLADNQVSDWYSLANLIPGWNTVSASVGGSQDIYIEIEFTYEPKPPTPFRQEPTSGIVSDNRLNPFVMMIQDDAQSGATHFWPLVRKSMSALMQSPDVFDSSLSVTGWEYLDGEVWTAFPVTGVPTGTVCRYTPQVNLELGVIYWQVRVKDDFGYGDWSADPWSLRMVLDVNALEGYALAIDSEIYFCTDLEIEEAANGEIGTISFTIPNLPDEDGIRPYVKIEYGTQVHVSIYDSTGFEKQYVGRIWQKTPGPVYMTLVASMGDKLLADRLLGQDYTTQDLGAILSHAISTYCSPVLASGIPNPLGIMAAFNEDGKSVQTIFKKAWEIWGILFWTETVATDWVQYIKLPSALTGAGIMVRDGDGNAE